MSDIALRVEGLGKRYRIGLEQGATGGYYRYKSLRDNLSGLARHPWQTMKRSVTRQPMNDTNSFWALRDINFEVKRGEVVGIIGRNGAGKSTLLKILSRITKPTTGSVDLFGRVGSLLEVGTGFHPELTGRENIFLNGAVLGMTQAEVKSKFDQIVAFSEVEKFLDTPVKQYSSGMYMRLAFAVAAHLEQEILIVDAVLAVGDAEFQKKCIGKMKDVAVEGRTVLFVSHNMPAIKSVCSHCYLLVQGSVAMAGDTQRTISEYLHHNQNKSMEFKPDPSRAPVGNDVITLHSVSVKASDGHTGPSFAAELPIEIEIAYRVHKATSGLRIGFRLGVSDGTVIFTSTDMDSDVRDNYEPRCAGLHVSRCFIPACFLNRGEYSITIGSDIPGVQVNFVCENIVSFFVEPTGGRDMWKYDGRLGVICPALRWEIRPSLNESPGTALGIATSAS